MNNRYKLFSLLLVLALLLTGCGQQPIGEVQAFSPSATIGQSGQQSQQQPVQQTGCRACASRLTMRTSWPPPGTVRT